MTPFTDLGIKTYEDYKRNERDIFDIMCGICEEFVAKHPSFVQQTIAESRNNYINVKEFNMGDKNIWRRINESNRKD